MDPSGFETFGTSHLVMLALFLAGTWPVIRLGRRLQSPAQRRRVSRVFALAIPAFTVPMQVVDLLPGRFDLQSTLPLQLCDLAWMAACVALWTHARWAVALTYYWGLVLTSQALLTPWLTATFPDPKFLGFWGMHYLIVWSAFFLVWGLRLRPDWRGFTTTVATTAVWMATVYLFNLAAGTNYGFLNEKPSTASLLDYLGPWPAYLLAEMMIVAVVWALMTWPWVRAGARGGRGPVGEDG